MFASHTNRDWKCSIKHKDFILCQIRTHSEPQNLSPEYQQTQFEQETQGVTNGSPEFNEHSWYKLDFWANQSLTAFVKLVEKVNKSPKGLNISGAAKEYHQQSFNFFLYMKITQNECRLYTFNTTWIPIEVERKLAENDEVQ